MSIRSGNGCHRRKLEKKDTHIYNLPGNEPRGGGRRVDIKACSKPSGEPSEFQRSPNELIKKITGGGYD